MNCKETNLFLAQSGLKYQINVYYPCLYKQTRSVRSKLVNKLGFNENAALVRFTAWLTVRDSLPVRQIRDEKEVPRRGNAQRRK